MTKIEYKVGDLIEAAKVGEVDVIAQQLNCFCTRKSGIAPLIDKAFPLMGEADDDTERGDKEKLGTFIVADIIPHNNPAVFGLYGQYHWNGRQRGELDTDYTALRSSFKGMQQCLDVFREREDIKIGLPLIGCGLAGGDWRVVSKIIEEELCDKGWKVIVYVLTEAELNKTLEGLHN